MKLVELLSYVFSTVNGMFPDALWGSADDILVGGHDNAIGLVVFPGSRSAFGKMYSRLFDFNSTFNEWGHTAVYVRCGGKIIVCLGFDPHRGKMVVFAITGKTKAVESGRIHTSGQIYEEGSLVSYPDAFCVEFPLSRDEARSLGNKLSSYNVGAHGQYKTTEVGRPGPCISDTVGNCISFIRAVLRSTLRCDIYSQLGVLHGTHFPEVEVLGRPDLHDFGAKQGRLTPLAQGNNLVLARSFSMDVRDVVPVQKGTLAWLTHNLSDTYMRTTFARVLLGGAGYIANRLIGYCAPSLSKSLTRFVGGWMPKLGTHHYLVGMCYVLLCMRTAIPACSNSRYWKYLYQLVNAASIVSFVRFAVTGDFSVLKTGGYEIGRTFLYLALHKGLKLQFR